MVGGCGWVFSHSVTAESRDQGREQAGQGCVMTSHSTMEPASLDTFARSLKLVNKSEHPDCFHGIPDHQALALLGGQRCCVCTRGDALRFLQSKVNLFDGAV